MTQERSSEEQESSLNKITNVQIENEAQVSNSSTIPQSESPSLNSYSPIDKNLNKNPDTNIVASLTSHKTKQVVNNRNKSLIVAFVAIVSIGLALGLTMLSKKYKPDIVSEGTEPYKEKNTQGLTVVPSGTNQSTPVALTALLSDFKNTCPAKSRRQKLL